VITEKTKCPNISETLEVNFVGPSQRENYMVGRGDESVVVRRSAAGRHNDRVKGRRHILSRGRKKHKRVSGWRKEIRRARAGNDIAELCKKWSGGEIDHADVAGDKKREPQKKQERTPPARH